MKLLILPPYFEPEVMASSHLNSDRYSAFSDAGLDMLVYTPMPTRGVDDKTRKIYKNIKTEFLYNNRLEVHRFSMYREGKNPIGRFLRYVFCFFRQLYFGLKTKDIDAIYLGSTPPIQGIIGGIIKKTKNIPFIYNLQDIFPDSLVGTGLAPKNGLLWKIGRCIENFTYRNADKIIVISEDFKRNIISKGVPESKIEVIYNWINEKNVVPVKDKCNSLYSELNLSHGTFKVVYAGNLGYAQNVMVLLKAAEQLKEYANIEFLIFGKGGLENTYKKYIMDAKLSNVNFYPLQPASKVSEVYSLANVSLVSCKKGLGKSAMPSKTWSILSAGRPVLCSFDKGGDLEKIVNKYSLGLFSESDNSEELSKNILYLYNNQDVCCQMGKNGREFVCEFLTKDICTKKYVDVILEVLNSKKK